MRTAAAMLGVLALCTTGCGGGRGSSPDTLATLNIVITDSPFTDAQAVLVSFSSVSAHTTGADFMPLGFAGGAASRTCDLKRLVGAEDVLGTGALPAGHYTGLRLVVASRRAVFRRRDHRVGLCHRDRGARRAERGTDDSIGRGAPQPGIRSHQRDDHDDHAGFRRRRLDPARRRAVHPDARHRGRQRAVDPPTRDPEVPCVCQPPPSAR